jgi:acyl carrier protein
LDHQKQEGDVKVSKNLEIYEKAFCDLFKLSKVDLGESLTYQSSPLWDSVGHMELIARLESDFAVMIDMDDVIDFNSYDLGKEILKKYGIDFE